MTTIRLTAAQAMVRYLAAQVTRIDGRELPLFAGIWAIFGHGNVAGMGEALAESGEALPTFRAHNEQAMAHAAIAFAKQSRRRRIMACTASIGPGATNMVTAAALAHVNRLPVLLIPGDVYASRRPDPVLQQVESFADATVSANDCFRPVSRFFDRITRPEQLLASLPRALDVLTDPAECGPVTLAFCQDVQAEAFDWPVSFFAPRLREPRRARPARSELQAALDALKSAKAPLIIAGGGVLYSGADARLARFAAKAGIPVAETQAGKGAMPRDHAMAMGAIGVTGTTAANHLARQADCVLAIGTRLQDFTTGSRSLFENPAMRLIGLNVQPFDAGKHGALPLVGDAEETLAELSAGLSGWAAPAGWSEAARAARTAWNAEAAAALAPAAAALPRDPAVIGAVLRQSRKTDVLVCAAGGLPGELHKLWEAGAPGGYHLEYGFSTMGYEIAGGLGVKMAEPDREVFVMVGDGSYLMMNSEITTSVMLGLKLTLVLLDNGGFGCIDRLQRATGSASFNNLLSTARHVTLPAVDFVAHARSLGAKAVKVSSLSGLETALKKARRARTTQVIVIETDPSEGSGIGGHWWDVAVPEVSTRPAVQEARKAYDTARRAQKRV
ncbi:MAG: 3D-(3,5/4)-trihydroxycyclohexane-1,2-dione acylhydrolase (decyclizing) [Beijerinckiaceae bacterium]|jgi:3D-(3,5/4)-trihydroxycyclohexane-1,2-dione acylhydrolase (decyclizing)|nr:3D-(3,5/4)-trihydroxycyclohexane-1,2-dione acylhydrolase (decyclizing) [Beijerinckiaceae bacterium]